MIKRRDGYDYDSKDLRFNNNKDIMTCVLTCFFAGLMGGIVGIAGGIILTPLFISMGMITEVLQGTS